jgi:hypothetical protein
MRNILSKVFVGVAITTIAAFGADNSIGTWKLNEGRSKYNPRPVVAQSHTSVREASDRGVTVRDTDNGTATNSTYTAKYDGKKYPVTNAPWDTVAIKQVDENRFTSKATKAGGKYYSSNQTTISKDGRTMTTTAKGKDQDGRAFNNTFVYDRQ